MTRRVALPVIFFVSGAAALLFETLWFRLTGLTFGNTAFASAIVLASFMAGLAIGNIVSLRFGGTLRTYALLEFGVAISALLLVLVLPSTQALFVGFFRTNVFAARIVLAFLMLIVPTTLMGATLPTIVRALVDDDRNFGRALGSLYGCNTLGAVAGSLAGELFLIRAIGIRGTGVVAAGLSLLAAFSALLIGRAQGAGRRAQENPAFGSPAPRAPRPAPFLAAAFLCGFSLLALEILWFRLIILFNFASSLAFAVMLAVVLAGIGGGALITSIVMARQPDADRWLPIAASASAVALIFGYWGFSPTLSSNPQLILRSEALAVFSDSLRLMLPVSALSGFLFTAIGRAVEREIGDERRATAIVTCSNTIGAAIGSAVAAFVMIPNIGVERGFFIVAVVYAIVAVLTMQRRVIDFVAVGVAMIAILAFPRGVMRSVFLADATRTYTAPNTRVAAIREGPIETAVYLRNDVHGEPHSFRLFTNGYSMSGTMFASRRYMSLFTYLPVALRPQVKSALLISYGTGVTAKTLTETKQLESIDVVDISKDILDLSEVVWPGATNPLRDPRVRVHIEDGRFFLRTATRRFDLITAEPPPPKAAGIVSLYSIEYFRLLRDRLTDRGIATYWLPVYQLDANEARTLVAAFCGAFDDCSLWSGGGGEWILAGGRGAWRAPDFASFSAQWRDPVVARGLSSIGVDTPEELAATFLADAKQLREFASNAKPLSDDFPLRLSSKTTLDFSNEFLGIIRGAPRAFASSAFVRDAIPAEAHPRSDAFTAEMMIDDVLLGRDLARPDVMRNILTRTRSRILPRLVLGSDPQLEAIAQRALTRGERAPDLFYIAGAHALGDRDFAAARMMFDAAGAKPWSNLAREMMVPP